MTDRYVVAGLAHVRSAWFTDVARWATSGSLPVEFVKCVSIDELQARVHSGRLFSAALLDGGLSAVDRDLVSRLAGLGIAPLVVSDPTVKRDWSCLGDAFVLDAPLDRATLLDNLIEHSRAITTVERDQTARSDQVTPPTWMGRLVTVTGRSGAGASTLAVALAQHLGTDPRTSGEVILVDLARRAHQALLHDAPDVVPGIQELIEANRSGRPRPDQVRSLTFDVADRGYRLLLGLRKPGDWITVRGRAFESGLDGLLSTARIVVADADSDLEGEATTGSLDIEDRNLMTRAALRRSDVVLAVTTTSTTGLHGLVGQLAEIRSLGVPGERILVVVNRAPRSARNRAELARVIGQLTLVDQGVDPHLGPVFVTERRDVDRLHRDLARFPSGLTEPVGTGVRAILDRVDSRQSTFTPVPITPGSMGTWADEAGASS